MGKKSFMALVMVSILVVGLIIARDGSRLYLEMGGISGSYTYNILFNSGLGMILGAVGLGILLGAISGTFSRRAALKDSTSEKKSGAIVLFGDWGITLGTFGALILLISGIFLGGTWSSRLVDTQGSIGFTLNTHFIGMIVLLFAICYLLTRILVSGDYSLFKTMVDSFRVKPKGNYALSYRFAVFTIVVVALSLFVKGAGLIAFHVFGWAEGIAVGTSVFHDIFALFGLILLTATVGLMLNEGFIREEVVKKAKTA